jgi:hypothetical protein
MSQLPKPLPYDPIGEAAYMSIGGLPEWYRLGARCSLCKRMAWVDRYAIAKRFSSNAYVGSLASRLRCTECGNRGGNDFVIEKLPR